MEQEDWEGFWRHWARRIGVYGVTVFFTLHHKPKSSYSDIAAFLDISYRQVLRAVKVLEHYNLAIVRVGFGGKKTEIELLDPIDWYIRPVEFASFPDNTVTCERHDWGREDNDKQCHHCGLLKAEEDYQRAGPYSLPDAGNYPDIVM